MKAASELNAVAFPQCSTECAAIRHLGASECDSICPHKFRQAKGKPWAFENLSQNELNIKSRHESPDPSTVEPTISYTLG